MFVLFFVCVFIFCLFFLIYVGFIGFVHMFFVPEFLGNFKRSRFFQSF